MSKKIIKQADSKEWQEGYNTGTKKGYSKGIKDALHVAQTMLEENGVHLSDTEFQAQFEMMVQSGEIDIYYDN